MIYNYQKTYWMCPTVRTSLLLRWTANISKYLTFSQIFFWQIILHFSAFMQILKSTYCLLNLNSVLTIAVIAIHGYNEQTFYIFLVQSGWFTTDTFTVVITNKCPVGFVISTLDVQSFVQNVTLQVYLIISLCL